MADEQEPFQRISVQDADKKREEGVAIIDCREADEYAEGHVPGAPLIPHMSVFQRIDEVEQIAGGKDKPLMFICAKGQRSAVASEFAAAAGFTDLYNVEGGTDAWLEAGLPSEK
jgi:rhodanese-related sulfurtransferase